MGSARSARLDQIVRGPQGVSGGDVRDTAPGEPTGHTYWIRTTLHRRDEARLPQRWRRCAPLRTRPAGAGWGCGGTAIRGPTPRRRVGATPSCAAQDPGARRHGSPRHEQIHSCLRQESGPACPLRIDTIQNSHCCKHVHASDLRGMTRGHSPSLVRCNHAIRPWQVRFGIEPALQAMPQVAAWLLLILVTIPPCFEDKRSQGAAA